MENENTAPISYLKNLKIYTETYGCTYNTGDTEKLCEIAKNNGCEIADSPDEADSILINTCVVIDKTEQNMYRRLSVFKDKNLFITGCLPPIAKEKLKEEFPNAHIIDSSVIHKCYMKNPTASKRCISVLQIARGCPGHCTYCITRIARGKLESFPMEDIVRQAKELVKSGASEIQLTAQDTASWGIDRDDNLRLPDLLRELCKIDGEFMIRIGMANPDKLLPILDDFLDAFSNKKIFKFLHIPVQSGSDSVLKLMGRRYITSEYEEIISRVRSRFPDVRISTDYIAGFPNETDEDAKASVDQIFRTKPCKVNITRFSSRPGTPASKFKKIPEYIKKDRSKALTDASNEVCSLGNKEWLGRHLRCIVTEAVKKGSVTARDITYQDIVIKEDLEVGTIVNAVITDYRLHYLIAEIER